MNKRTKDRIVANQPPAPKPRLSIYFADRELYEAFVADAEREHRDYSKHATYLIRHAMQRRQVSAS